jgi:hypothetical protein
MNRISRKIVRLFEKVSSYFVNSSLVKGRSFCRPRKRLRTVLLTVVAGAPILIVSMTHANAGSSHVIAVEAVLNARPAESPTTGPCIEGYAMKCPSNSCSCLQFAGVVVGNLGGRGGAEVHITLDNGEATSAPLGCVPIFGETDLITETPLTLNAAGVLCGALQSAGRESVSGGYGILATQNGPTGTGTISGTVSGNGRLHLKLTGETIR